MDPILTLPECTVGASVSCPFTGNACAGDQCCPGTWETNGETFVCPSASTDTLSGCGMGKVTTCVPPPTTTTTTTTIAPCSLGESVSCPYSGVACAGDQCCPGTQETLFQTTTCPSASKAHVDGCSKPKVQDCLPELMLSQEKKTVRKHTQKTGFPITTTPSCSAGASVSCPYTGTACAGEQCCPGSTFTFGQTFACPSASADFVEGCALSKLTSCLPEPTTTTTTTTVQSCSAGASVSCPYSGSACAGNQCCPGTWQTMFQTSTCPSATQDSVAGCALPKQENCLAAPSLLETEQKSSFPIASALQCQVGASVTCPFTSTSCAGNQCCPGSIWTFGQTFTCPSASQDDAGCDLPKMTTCVATEPKTCNVGESVSCPNTGTACAGDQCCPGSWQTMFQTTTCPSASTSHHSGCDRPKDENCVAR